MGKKSETLEGRWCNVPSSRWQWENLHEMGSPHTEDIFGSKHYKSPHGAAESKKFESV